MSKGKKIVSSVCLLDRPVYKDILRVFGAPYSPIGEPNEPLTLKAATLKDKRLMTSRELLNEIKLKMKPQTFNTYLKNLVKYGEIKKIQTGDGRHIVYRSLTFKEWRATLRSTRTKIPDYYPPIYGLDKLASGTPKPHDILELSDDIFKYAIRMADTIEAIIDDPKKAASYLDMPWLKENPESLDFFAYYRFYSTRNYIINRLKPEKDKINEFLKKSGQGIASVKVVYGNGKIIEI